MNILKLGFAAAAATLIAGTAQAGTIIHDELSDFTIAEDQGVQFDDSAVDPSRSNLGSMFDNNPGNATGTFYSVGLGGAIAFTIVPPNYSIAAGTVIEVTNIAGQKYPEALEVWIGNDTSLPVGDLSDADLASLGFAKLGFFVNSDGNGGLGPRADDLSTVADLSVTTFPGTEGGLYQIFNIVGAYNTLVFKDASGVSDGGQGQNPFGFTRPAGADGFDIGELSVTSVPEPGTLALLGAGLAGLGLFGRRRKAA